MMNLLDFFVLLAFDIGLLAIYLLIGFIAFMLVQLISYRIFKFNLYKWLMYNLIDKQM